MWNIKDWQLSNKYDYLTQLLNKQILYCFYNKNKFINLDENKLNKLSNPQFQYIYRSRILKEQKLDIIFIYNNNLYKIKNNDFQINNEIYNKEDEKEIDLYLIRKSKKITWVFKNINRKKIIDGYDFIKLNKDLSNYKYKSKFYSICLILWLKLQIKIKIKRNRKKNYRICK